MRDLLGLFFITSIVVALYLLWQLIRDILVFLIAIVIVVLLYFCVTGGDNKK